MILSPMGIIMDYFADFKWLTDLLAYADTSGHELDNAPQVPWLDV